MINEPRTYRHSPIRLALVILLLGILGMGIMTTISQISYILIPLVGFYGIVFLMILYSMTTKTTISDHEISTQTLLGTKSLTWGEIHHVSGRGNAIKLNNSDGDVTVTVNPQLPGYEEIVEWIGIKRPDLFDPQEYSEMKKSWAGAIFVSLIGLIFLSGLGVFVLTQANDVLVPFLVFVLFFLIAISMTLATPQTVSIQGNSIEIAYLFNKKQLSADEIASIDLRFTQTRNGKRYFIAVSSVTGKFTRISGLNPNLPVAYLVLKNWHKKNTASDNSPGRL